jgi:4-hydroxy-tetrahydrodipicolinate synthase
VCLDQDGIRWHFEQVAQATHRSIVLYNVPHRTGVSIVPETVARLLAHGNIAAIKECVAENFKQLRDLPIALLRGADEAFVDCLEAGGSGAILASAHLCGDVLCRVQRLFKAGRRAEARRLFATLLPLIRLLFVAPNPAAIKPRFYTFFTAAKAFFARRLHAFR